MALRPTPSVLWILGVRCVVCGAVHCTYHLDMVLNEAQGLFTPLSLLLKLSSPPLFWYTLGSEIRTQKLVSIYSDVH
jgi:hypothetical protein